MTQRRWAVVRDTNSDVGFFVEFIFEMNGEEIVGFSYSIKHIYEGTKKEIERWFEWSFDPEDIDNSGKVTWFEDIVDRGRTRATIKMMFSTHPRMK